MLQCAVAGIHGRMGRAVVQALAAHPRCCCCAGIGRTAQPFGDIPVFDSVAALRQSALRPDAFIDFSAAQAGEAIFDYCQRTATPLVSAVTGYTSAQWAQLQNTAKSTAVLHSPNFSLGAAALEHLARQAALLLQSFDMPFDVQIIEMHHRTKQDTPSGTAGRLAHTLSNACGMQVPIHAVRAGGIIGDHTILLAAEHETLSLVHHAQSRSIFAKGAVAAAEFLHLKPAGLYTMQQLLHARKELDTDGRT